MPHRRRTITKDTIKSIPSSEPGRKTLVWDDRLLGFGAYRRSDGMVVFVYQYRVPMRPARRITLGRLGELTPAQARAIAEEHAFHKARGIDPMEKRRNDAKEADAAQALRISVYVDDYVRRRKVEKRPLTPQHERILVRDVAGLMPDVRVDRITTREIDAFLEELAKRSISARTWGLIYLKVILNDAKRRGTIVKSAADAYKVPARVERERVLKRIELQRILEAAKDMRDTHGLVYECILRTARRKEEVAALTWEEIDQATWEWTLPAARTKQADLFVMTLPPQVVGIIESLHPDKRKRKGFVFSFDGSKSIRVGADQDKSRIDAHIQRRMDLAEAEGGAGFIFDHWVPHDFRTTATTILADDPFNVPTDDLELMLGHAVPKSKYNRAQRKSAVNRAIVTWNGYLDHVIAAPDAWPGGRELPVLGRFETKPLWLRLRETWPKRKYDDARVKKAKAGKAK